MKQLINEATPETVTDLGKTNEFLDQLLKIGRNREEVTGYDKSKSGEAKLVIKIVADEINLFHIEDYVSVFSYIQETTESKKGANLTFKIISVGTVEANGENINLLEANRVAVTCSVETSFVEVF